MRVPGFFTAKAQPSKGIGRCLHTSAPARSMSETLGTGRSAALAYDLKARCSTSKARASILHLPHGPVDLPIFMPVATQASLKGLTPEQLEDTSCRLCLNNTYHLGLKPGQEVLDAIGGAHKLQGWNYNILTDSASRWCRC